MEQKTPLKNTTYMLKVEKYIHLIGMGYQPDEAKAEMNLNDTAFKRIKKTVRERLNSREHMEENISMIRAAQIANYKRSLVAYSKVSDERKPQAVNAIDNTIKTMENTMSKIGMIPQEVNNIKIEGSADSQKLKQVLDRLADDKDEQE